MKTGMRSLLVIAGLSLVYAASLIFIAKPLPHLALAVRPVPVSLNLPYVLYARFMQWLFGSTAGVIMFANALLVWATACGVFRMGWRLADARHPILGGAVAMGLFLLNPLALVLPLTLGFYGEVLWAPLLLVFFMNGLYAVENWSAFMRALVLAAVWSCFLWVHIPSALLILIAFIPWMLYSRRPATASGTFATVFCLGSAIFSILWTFVWLIAKRWIALPSPLTKWKDVGLTVQQGMSAFDGISFWDDRLLHVTAWLSPFLLVWGIWLSLRSIRSMISEHRSTSGHIGTTLALVVLAIAISIPGQELLPGAWYLLLILAIWTPMAAHDLAKKENFYSRGFRFTFLSAFVVCVVMMWALHLWTPRGTLLPSGATLIALMAVCSAAAALFYGLLKRYALPIENRLQAFLAGSTVGYILTFSCQFFQ
jgi:hypothetical protein